MNTNKQFLTPWLLEKITKGDAILFLGAGAVKGATGKSKEVALTGPQLRDRISDQFLGGELKERPLAEVAEIAKNESSLSDVQSYIYRLFEPLQPADFHKIIPSFRWHSIITTNYDFVVERAYEECENPLQKLVPVIGDGDAQHQDWSDSGVVPYLKLHGCLSAISNHDLPLILSSEEYAKHRKNRNRVFDMFAGWATSHPIIFCGYDIGDANIQQILFDMGDQSVNRTTYCVVKPGFTEFDLRYWSSRRFVPEKMTFEAFLTAIDGLVEPKIRMLSILRSKDSLSIASKIVKGEPSDGLVSYLETSLVHVHTDITCSKIEPIVRFLQGYGFVVVPDH